MAEHLKIFREAFVDKLETGVRNGESIADYFKRDFETASDSLFETSIVLPDCRPTLDFQSANDAESAIAIYEYLGPLTATQASDRRLWTYLAHLTFRDYTMERWPVNEDMEWQKAASSVLDHWFVSENDRSLRRHSLARLWWAASLTVSPWEADPASFISLRNDDAYVYTRLLLSTQDIFLNTLERSIGRSKKILIALLESFRSNSDLAQNRHAVRNLIKEVNLVSGYRKLTLLPFENIFEIVNGLADQPA